MMSVTSALEFMLSVDIWCIQTFSLGQYSSNKQKWVCNVCVCLSLYFKLCMIEMTMEDDDD